VDARVADVPGGGLGCLGAVTAAGRKPPACAASRCPWWVWGKAASAPGRCGPRLPRCARGAADVVRIDAFRVAPVRGVRGRGLGVSGAGLAPGPAFALAAVVPAEWGLFGTLGQAWTAARFTPPRVG